MCLRWLLEPRSCLLEVISHSTQLITLRLVNDMHAFLIRDWKRTSYNKIRLFMFFYAGRALFDGWYSFSSLCRPSLKIKLAGKNSTGFGATTQKKLSSDEIF